MSKRKHNMSDEFSAILKWRNRFSVIFGASFEFYWSSLVRKRVWHREIRHNLLLLGVLEQIILWRTVKLWIRYGDHFAEVSAKAQPGLWFWENWSNVDLPFETNFLICLKNSWLKKSKILGFFLNWWDPVRLKATIVHLFTLFRKLRWNLE